MNTVNGTTTAQVVIDRGSVSLLGNSISFFSADGSPVRTYVVDADVIHVVKPGLTMDFKK